MNKLISELLQFSIINIDKPSGPTSFLVDLHIKKALNANKTSHFGTLDPQVTGVLPIALNRACRLSPWFMHKKKRYVGIMRIHSEIAVEKLKEEIKNFIGKIKQLPPVKSRVKRQEREREIYSWDILEQQGKDFLFDTEVQAGTYIRKLIHDLGLRIGGAHMLELRRIEAGIFSEEKIHNLYEFDRAVKEYKKGNESKLREMLIDAEETIKQVMLIVQINQSSVKKLLTGKPIFSEDIIGKLNIKEGSDFAAFSDDRFIGVYKAGKEGNIIARSQFILN